MIAPPGCRGYFKTLARGVGAGSERSTHWNYTTKKFYSTRDPVYIRSKVRNGHRSHGLCMIRRTASMWTVPEEEAVDTDYRPISYDSVGLYFPIVQIIAANIAVAGVVMASSVVLPNYASATRSLLLATTAAVGCSTAGKVANVHLRTTHVL